MYLKEFLEQFKTKKIKLYVDMDGVISDYQVGDYADNYHLKRPLITSLQKLEIISKMPNVEVCVLSVTRMDEGMEQKHLWLDKYVPFVQKENRNILSRESNDFKMSSDLKVDFLRGLKKNENIIVFIDDDPSVLNKIQENVKDIVLLKDTALVD